MEYGLAKNIDENPDPVPDYEHFNDNITAQNEEDHMTVRRGSI
jgi:hypothetical protein